MNKKRPRGSGSNNDAVFSWHISSQRLLQYAESGFHQNYGNNLRDCCHKTVVYSRLSQRLLKSCFPGIVVFIVQSSSVTINLMGKRKLEKGEGDCQKREQMALIKFSSPSAPLSA